MENLIIQTLKDLKLPRTNDCVNYIMNKIKQHKHITISDDIVGMYWYDYVDKKCRPI